MSEKDKKISKTKPDPSNSEKSLIKPDSDSKNMIAPVEEEVKVEGEKQTNSSELSKKSNKEVNSDNKELNKIAENEADNKVKKDSEPSASSENNPYKQLRQKKDIVKKLRELVNGNEDKDTFNKVKDLQNLWKEIGQLDNSKDKSLWTTYNALLDRFYDNRGIYYELKDLDRKKNLVLKTEICVKAESLVNESNVMKSVASLNELHTEFKHIGPVSRDIQNEVWERLKKASDEVYKKKKEFISNIKESLTENLEKKTQLLEEINQLKIFKSDNIREWNNKTKNVLSLKDKWNSIGGVPKPSTKNISKEFWNSFKEFFANKSIFFKKIDESFNANLKLKQDLIDKVNTLKSSDNWVETSKEIQLIQKEWKKIGKVPIKKKDTIFQEFKDSCDFFYERMRVEDKDTIKMYEDNFSKKNEICDKIETLLDSDSFDQDQFFKLQVRFLEIGHVPKDKIDVIKERFKKTIELVVMKSSKSMDQDSFDRFKFIIELNSLAKNPYSKSKIIKKKSDIIKKINSIQSEIKNLRNNIFYLKASVAADNLKKEYTEKINNSDKEIESLKLQLNLINKV